MSHFVALFIAIWFFISQIYYIIGIKNYMKKHNIKNIQKSSTEHQEFAMTLYLFCLVSWWRLI